MSVCGINGTLFVFMSIYTIKPVKEVMKMLAIAVCEEGIGGCFYFSLQKAFNFFIKISTSKRASMNYHEGPSDNKYNYGGGSSSYSIVLHN